MCRERFKHHVPQLLTLRERLNKALSKATAAAQGEVAREFDGIHSVGRACEVGSLDQVIPANELRSRLIQGLGGKAS